MAEAPVRVTVLAPVAAPYREPLFTALADRPELELTVIYADAGQPSWDVPAGYFAVRHHYPAIHLGSRQLPRPGRTPIMFPRGLETALARSRPQVVVASEYGPLALRARRWDRARGIPHLLFTECTPAIDALLPAPQLALHRRFARSVSGAIAVSSAARRRLLGFGVPTDRVTVALQSADLAAIRSARSPAPGPGPSQPAEAGDGARPEPLRILTVGRLVPDKNLDLLLRAARQAATDLAPREVAVDVVGSGFEGERLRRLATELGLATTFHGHADAAALAAHYARADVFALLSSYEPFGVVFREAAAGGLPIVCTDVAGAVGDVAIPGENAFAVRPGDLSGAAVALTRLATQPELRARMAAASVRIDAATDGTEVDAFCAAVLAARS